MTVREIALWGHLLGVVVWVGGAFFWTIALFTAESRPDRDDGNSWLETLGHRVYVAGWEALGLIVLTGFFNLIVGVRTGAVFRADYQRTLGIKLTLVAGMVLVQLWQHFGLLPQLGAARANQASWLTARRRLLVTSVLVVVLAAGALWFAVQLHHG